MEETKQENKCSICLSFINEPKLMTQCNHIFCGKCIIELITKNVLATFCPNCRESIKNLNEIIPNANVDEYAVK